MILRVKSRCCEILQYEIFRTPDLPKNPLHLEISTFLAAVAWAVLLPLFVEVAGGLAVEEIRRKYRSDRATSEIEAEVMSTVGKDLIKISPEQREECVIIINEVLKPLGVSREHSRRIFDMLLEEIEKKVEDKTQGSHLKS